MASAKELIDEAFSKGSGLFHLLDEPGRVRLAAVARVETYPPGQVVVREGEVGGAFYLIVKGEVSVEADNEGTPKRLAVMKEGMFFGEMSAVTQQTRSATVTALGPLELIAFDREKVQPILNEYPSLRELLGRVSVSRSEDTLTKMLFSDDGAEGGS